MLSDPSSKANRLLACACVCLCICVCVCGDVYIYWVTTRLVQSTLVSTVITLTCCYASSTLLVNMLVCVCV